MNIRLSFMLVAVLLIFGGAFLVVRLTRSGEPTPDLPRLYSIGEDAITHIGITIGEETVDYDKKLGSGYWCVQDDPDIRVSGLFSGTSLLLSGPKVSRELATVTENPASTYGLEPPQTIIQVNDRNGLGYELHLGHLTPDEQNRYVRVAGEPELFLVVSIWGQVIEKLVTDPPYRLSEEDESPVLC